MKCWHDYSHKFNATYLIIVRDRINLLAIGIVVGSNIDMNKEKNFTIISFLNHYYCIFSIFLVDFGVNRNLFGAHNLVHIPTSMGSHWPNSHHRYSTLSIYFFSIVAITWIIVWLEKNQRWLSRLGHFYVYMFKYNSSHLNVPCNKFPVRMYLNSQTVKNFYFQTFKLSFNQLRFSSNIYRCGIYCSKI